MYDSGQCHTVGYDNIYITWCICIDTAVAANRAYSISCVLRAWGESLSRVHSRNRTQRLSRAVHDGWRFALMRVSPAYSHHVKLGVAVMMSACLVD